MKNERNKTEEIKAMPYDAMLAAGLTPSQIVRKKYPKAWSRKFSNEYITEYSILDGELDKDCVYFPHTFTDPAGKLIAKGKTLQQAWQNAAQVVANGSRYAVVIFYGFETLNLKLWIKN